MAEVAAAPARSRQFLLRRLHSLSGIVPIGAFLVMHLGTNAMVAFNQPGEDYFQQQVDRIHALGPLLIPVEILFIFIPIAFHAGLGVKIWLESKPNTMYYPYLANFRYMLQRVTGVIALIFIAVHLWHMHWLGGYFGGGYFDPHDASRTAAGALQSGKWWAWPLYQVGIVSAVYHFANGIWTSLITWGVTIGRESQRKAGYVCAVIGVALGLTGIISMRGFMKYADPKMPEQRYTAPKAAGEAETSTTAHTSES